MMSVSESYLLYSIILLLALVSNVAPGGPGYSDYAPRRRVVTRVRYEEPAEQRVRVTHEVHHVVHKKRRKIRPALRVVDHELAPVHPLSGYEGSYVAVAGDPSRGAVHVVENVAALGRDSVTVVNGVRVRNRKVAVLKPTAVLRPAPVVPHIVAAAPLPPPPVPHPGRQGGFVQSVAPIAPRVRPDGVAGDRLPLPKCSYVNTDFPGDDLFPYDDDDGVVDEDDYEKRGINAGSARACKSLCRTQEGCSFWTYREGYNRDTNSRDCFLKRAVPGLPIPREVVPRIGFVSGTKDNNCECLMNEEEEEEVCPYKNPKGLVYPWRSTDQEEDDLSRGLLPSGWRRVGDPLGYSGAYPGLEESVYPGSSSRASLEDDIRALRAQLDSISRRLE